MLPPGAKPPLTIVIPSKQYGCNQIQKDEVIGSIKTFATAYKTTQNHNRDDHSHSYWPVESVLVTFMENVTR
jgi:hypothetical protein